MEDSMIIGLTTQLSTEDNMLYGLTFSFKRGHFVVCGIILYFLKSKWEYIPEHNFWLPNVCVQNNFAHIQLYKPVVNISKGTSHWSIEKCDVVNHNQLANVMKIDWKMGAKLCVNVWETLFKILLLVCHARNIFHKTLCTYSLFTIRWHMTCIFFGAKEGHFTSSLE